MDLPRSISNACFFRLASRAGGKLAACSFPRLLSRGLYVEVVRPLLGDRRHGAAEVRPEVAAPATVHTAEARGVSLRALAFLQVDAARRFPEPFVDYSGLFGER